MSGSTTPRLVVRESHDDQDQPSSSPTPTYSRPGSARVGVRGTPATALVNVYRRHTRWVGTPGTLALRTPWPPLKQHCQWPTFTTTLASLIRMLRTVKDENGLFNLPYFSIQSNKSHFLYQVLIFEFRNSLNENPDFYNKKSHKMD